MTPKLTGLFICEHVLRDLGESNKLSFINIVSGYHTAQLPFVNPPITLVARFSGGQGVFHHFFEVVDVGEQVLHRSPESEFFLENRLGEHVTMHTVGGLMFPQPGSYWILSRLNGQEQARVPLQLNYRAPTGAAGG